VDAAEERERVRTDPVRLSAEILKHCNRLLMSPADRSCAMASMNILIDAGWKPLEIIPWWLSKDWGECRVLADCFNTPGTVRLYWKDVALDGTPLHGTPEIIASVLAEMGISVLAWFPFNASSPLLPSSPQQTLLTAGPLLALW
jgi:hypothetical protein